MRIRGFLIYTLLFILLTQSVAQESESKIKQLNSFERQFVREGVYSFNYEIEKNVTTIDKFGNEKEDTQHLGNVKYEVSFTSKKLIILNNEKQISEEILFKEKYIISDIWHNSTSYEFFIESWVIRNNKTKQIIEDLCVYKPIKRCSEDSSIRLVIRKGYYPYFWAWFAIFDYDGTHDLEYGNGIRPVESVPLKDALYYYQENSTPEYVNRANYSEKLLGQE